MSETSVPMAVPIQTYRFTADDFQRMGEIGILDEDDRVELLDGELIVMRPIGPPHIAVVNRLTAVFAPLTGRAILHVQNPVRLDPHSEPLPDFQLLRFVPDYYASRPVAPADVLLLVEVADSSLAYDRRVKTPKYAATGIREYWIVDVNGAAIHVHRDPGGTGYREAFEVARSGRLAPLAFPEFEVEAESILG